MSDGIFAGEPGEENTSKLKIDYIRKNFRDRVGGPGSETGGRYSVRLQNSQNLHLTEEYTFSLNTNVGVITPSIDLI